MNNITDVKVDIFNCLILLSKLNINNKELIKDFNLLKSKNRGRFFSNKGGWQSENLDLKNKKLHPLINNIIEKTIEYLKICSFKNLDFKILNLWVNINSYKDFNSKHSHPDSLISGTYYLQTPKNCGNINFFNPCNFIEYSWKYDLFKKNNKYNSHKYFFIPKKNLLLLFPSWLSHDVEPNFNKKINRISISFNIGI